ncbi:MAG: hypothetical protein IJ729_07800, partial [Alloprevotella sp.]|nr:hypothetical protein [Alloprevotella sp.]
MQIEGFTLRWDDVPPDYRPCFTAACPRSAECLRYAAGQCLPRSLTCGPAIYPTALPDGEGAASGCPHFRP